MQAAVVKDTAAPPELADYASPQGDDGTVVARMLATALNPVDVAIAGGGFPFRPATAPFVAGYSGVGEKPDGTRVYIEGPPLPYGTLAEYAPLTPEAEIGEVGSLDPATAAAIGVAGTAAWLALTRRAELRSGESVLVLGSGGSGGRVAVQAARALGASTVVAVARSETSRSRALSDGADEAIATGDGLSAELARVAPTGFDVIVDFLWGDPVAAALLHTARGARLAQVGNQAGTAATIDAGWRNRGARLLAHSNFLTELDDRRAAFAQLVRHASEGTIRLDHESVPLDRFGEAWSQLTRGDRTRWVVHPDRSADSG